MSLYNMIMGFNPACVVIMPMLGRKQNEYPRFRDCFITDEKNIAIYTRVGGANRNCGYGEEELYNDENFLTTNDDEYDNTYATYEFKVPEKWKADFDLILDGKLAEVSEEYINYVKEFYPKLAVEGVIDKIFGKVSGDINQFCKDVVDFLQSEYNDSYSFKVERYTALPPEFQTSNSEKVELKIDISSLYRITIVNDSMQYLFKLYLEGKFLEDLGQYLWQKELVDMIEGG